MARSLRIEFPGAWYHAMNRGGSRRVVFEDDRDRHAFLRTLEEASATYGLEVHGFCLMPNHYHLLLRTPRGNLGRAMRHLDGVYTQRFNRTHGADGALFRGRYHAIVIDADAYLLAVSRYVHLNPVDAGLAVTPEQYRWSSYGAFVGRDEPPAWLHVDAVLDCFGDEGRRTRYREFVAQGVGSELEDFYARDTPNPVLGDRDFIESLGPTHPPRDREIPQQRALESPPGFDEIVHSVAETFSVPIDDVLVGGRRNDARSVAIHLCRRLGGYRSNEIARHFGFGHYSAVTVTSRRLEERLKKDPGLAERYAIVVSRLSNGVSRVKT